MGETAMSQEMRKRRRRPVGRVLGAVLAAVVLTTGTAVAAGAAPIVVGSKDFVVNQAVAQAYGQALAATGSDVTYKENLGGTEVVYAALQNGDIDMYPEYANTFLETSLSGTGGADATKVIKDIRAGLPDNIIATNPAPANDVNSFVVLKKTAKKYKLKTISDLKKVAKKLTFGTTPQCETRDLCLGAKEQQLYNLQFKEVKKLDEGGPITVGALKDGDIQVALLFSGSSVIPKNSVILTDDKALQGADNPFVLIRKDKATPKVLKTINAVSKKLTTKAYNEMAVATTVDKADPSDVAALFLEDSNIKH
jgi:osmoprotectant transport system substrate-binding protein